MLVAPQAITEVSRAPAEEVRGAHDTAVTEVHAVLKQLSDIVSDAVGLRFEAPNPSPLIVTAELLLLARFALSRLQTLTSGAEACGKSEMLTKLSQRASPHLYHRR